MDKYELDRQLETQQKKELEEFTGKKESYDSLYEKCKEDLIKVGIEEDLKTIAEWYSDNTSELFTLETKIDNKSFMYIIRKRNKYLEKHPLIKAFVELFSSGRWDDVLVIDARPQKTDSVPKRRHHFRLHYQDSYGNSDYKDEYRDMIKLIRKIVVDKIHDQEGRLG